MGLVAPVAMTRMAILIGISIVVMTIASLALLPLAVVTLFRARRLYAVLAMKTARLLLRVWGIRLVVHQRDPLPTRQVVYVSNHSSTLDVLVLVALGLPNTRFFLSGFLRWYGPFGIIASLMGTFFTVPQDRPDERVRIFQRADRILRRTGESVFLSPEGERILGGVIGRFNKGAFHLATSLRAPIVPLYFYIPPESDPGLGYNIRPGTVEVTVKPPIETRNWRIDDLVRNKERVRQMFVTWHEEAKREVRRAG
jgi:1-acyl-sn-glycerol-3-phosphate acyltransferase